jgi:hypothetical protein
VFYVFLVLLGNELADESCLEPSAKRICVEAADGQRYMVTMPSQQIDGDAVAAMQVTPTCIPEFEDLQNPKEKVDVTQAWFTSRDDKTALTSKGMVFWSLSTEELATKITVL